MTKRNSPSAIPHVDKWRALYTAALFEKDEQKLPERIAQAEKELIQRAREVFTTANNIAEEQAIDDALYALNWLRDCSKQENKKIA